MVVETDGYLALIEHLAFNLDIFSSESGDEGTESIEAVVTDMMDKAITPVIQQCRNSTVFSQLTKEENDVREDLSEVLAGVWSKPATNEQITFLDELIALLKNLFNSAVQSYNQEE